MPMKPDVNHPLHQAALEEEEQIAAMVSAQEPPAEEPTVPEDLTVVTPEPILSQEPTQPAAPARDDVLASLEQKFETMAGRMEALNAQNRELEQALSVKDDNRRFLESRLKELTDALAEREEMLKKLAAEREVDMVSKEFQSELIDTEHFKEIYRGILPHLQARDKKLEELLRKNEELAQKLNEVPQQAESKVTSLEQKLFDRTVMKREPAVTQMLQSKSGQEWLAQRVPGTRRTRMQELSDAYAERDEDYIITLAQQWKQETSSPQSGELGVDEQRSIVNQAPQSPRKQVQWSEEMVANAFQQMLAGKLTREQFKKIRTAYEQQTAGGAA